MAKAIDPVIVSGQIMGQCPKCREPYVGQMDADSESVILECVLCHHKGRYLYRWPDELPKVILRHWKSRELLRGSKKRKKKKQKNPDGVLKGQMSFKIPRDYGLIGLNNESM